MLELETKPQLEQRLEDYFDRLWPINRSITGPGYRESLAILNELIPTTNLSFKTREKVFDWTVPKEWAANDAYFIGPDGKKYCDFKEHNLHLVGYSTPFKGKISLAELKKHLYTHEDQPTAIPYVTSYYKERWGFCIAYKQYEKLPEGEYEVVVDTKLYDGEVVVGEAFLPGETEEEVFFSSYLCHPSMANNELSGPLVLSELYNQIKAMPNRRYSYRFVILPETIGSICYLTQRGLHLKDKVKAGYVISCVGDPGPLTYKISKNENTLSDRAALEVGKSYPGFQTVNYDPNWSSDDRQYSCPGFDLPIGTLTRSIYGSFPEYHTSLDNKDFISFAALAQTVEAYTKIVKTLEKNKVYKHTVEYCDPQLGPRGLYPTVSMKVDGNGYSDEFLSIGWLLSFIDGKNDLLAIAERSKIPFDTLAEVAGRFAAKELLVEI